MGYEMALLDIDGCRQQAGYQSRTTIYNYIRAGLWTKPVKFGDRASRWPDYEVDAMIHARIAGQTDAEIRSLVRRLEHERTASYAAA